MRDLDDDLDEPTVEQEIADRCLRQIAVQYGSTTRRDFRVIELVLAAVAENPQFVDGGAGVSRPAVHAAERTPSTFDDDLDEQLAAGAAAAVAWAAMAADQCPRGGLLWGNYDDDAAVSRSWGRTRTGRAKDTTKTRTMRRPG